MKTISWSLSECKDGWLHRYKILGQDSSVVIEMCNICQDTQIFRLVNGKTDNMKYLQYHLHNALPPYHKLYARQHGI